MRSQLINGNCRQYPLPTIKVSSLMIILNASRLLIMSRIVPRYMELVDKWRLEIEPTVGVEYNTTIGFVR
jgi:hypothetical protein